MLRNPTKAARVIGAFVLGLAAAGPSHALPISSLNNTSFEDPSDFHYWTTVGNTSIQASDFKPPADGSVQAVLSNGAIADLSSSAATTNIAGLDSFLNLFPGTLEAYNAKSGSGIRQSFTGAAGSQVTFSYDFVTNEGSNADMGFFTLSLPTGGTIIVSLMTPGSAGLVATDPLDNLSGYFNRETGYQMGTILLPGTGTYTLGFGVVNIGDTSVPSGLLVDAIHVQAPTVPLPAGACLIPLGLAAAALHAAKLRRCSKGPV
jgi:hypothetical protein